MEPKDSLEVWNKFLEFESNIGDLASVVKVEKRRAGILEEAGIAVGENKHTIQVGKDFVMFGLFHNCPPTR